MNFKKQLHRFLSVLLPLCLLVSCGTGEDPIETGEGELRNYATPSSGVRREKKEEVPPEEPAEPMAQVICIDPGHGFDDSGCSSDFLGGLHEDDINLAISLLLDEELRRLGYETIMTHDGETFPVTSAYDNNNKYRPEERTAYAATLDIDYYVSIHCNSYPDSSAYGTRIYYYDGAIKTEHTSGAIAESINTGILGNLEAGTKCTVHDMTSGVFHVLRETTVPASLIEVGFVTNESDAKRMTDPAWQKAFAEGVAAGIDSYYRAEDNPF